MEVGRVALVGSGGIQKFPFQQAGCAQEVWRASTLDVEREEDAWIQS